MNKIFIIWTLLLTNLALTAQTNLPYKVKVYLPSYIENSREKNNTKWMSYISDEDYGRSTNQFWEVYSDRNQNRTYQDPSLNNPTDVILNFKEKLIIADIKNGFALVYNEKKSQPKYPNIGADAISKGWISLNNLLLWDKCPMDQFNVFQKAVVLKDIESKAKGDISPFFLSNPENRSFTEIPANDLEFYFVFKKQNINGIDYFLLAKEWDIKNSTGQTNNLYGWMDDGNVTTWDNRVCFEPVYDKRSVDFFNNNNIVPRIFDKKSESIALQYSEDGIGIEKKDILDFKGRLTTKRQNPYQIRFPLIKDYNNTIKVATIGNIGNGNDSKLSQDKINELKKKLDDFLTIKNTGNIIFVIDGTISMQKYYAPLAKAIEQSRYSTKINNKNRFKFGAVVYRDYSDKDKLIELKKLTNELDEVSSWLLNRDIKQEVGDPTYEEAMFNGIDAAAEMLDPNISNFIFLIGDCGNHETDTKGFTEQKIIDKLIEKRVNLLAFQANNNYRMSSNRFSIQANRIINGLVQGLSREAGSPNTIGLRLGKNNLFETFKKESKELPAFICKYTFCKPNISKTPEELNQVILSMIVEFDDYIDLNVKDIQNQLRGASPRYPERVLEILKLAGFTESDINAYIESRKVLKIEGFTAINPLKKGFNIFEPVLFISGDELGSLVKELKRLDSPSYVTQRKAYEEALSNLARAYFGLSDVKSIDIDDLFKKLYGVNFKPSSFVIKDGNKEIPIKIEWISKKEKVTDDLLKSLITTFAGKTRNLSFILSKDESEYRFKSNDIPYFYIPIKELP